MSLACLRPDLPRSYAFSVTEKPWSVKLDQNEGAVDLPGALKRELAAELAARPWHRYVQPAEYLAAKTALAGTVGVAPEQLALVNGGDHAIASAFLVGGGPGRRALWFEPTYPFVAHAARMTGTAGRGVPLGLDIDGLDAATLEAHLPADLVCLVAPNNPTGGAPARPAVDAALADPARLVFVDEAYADFAPATLLERARHTPNLVLGRSMSKASLAAGHCGYVIGHPELIAAVERMWTAPYHLNWLHIVLAHRYGDIAPHVRAMAAAVAGERDRVSAALAALPGISPRPSGANFVLFGVEGGAAGAAAIHAALAGAGVRIRDVGGVPGLAGYLRVTIGTAADNDAFLDALGAALA